MVNNIQKLRELTGAGVMECKKALSDAGGDFDKAAALIQEQGLIKAEKKAARATGAGFLESYIHNSRVGVLMEIRCETDFAAHSEPVRALARELAMQIAAMDPENVPALLSESYIRDEKMTVEQLIKNTVAKVGENIQVARFCRYEL